MRTTTNFVYACLILMAGGCLQLNAALWDDATPHDGGWLSSEWYGWLNEVSPEWNYHTEHGFQLPSGNASDDVYFYDANLRGWVWTSEVAYPRVFKLGVKSGWYAYNQGGAPGDRTYSKLSNAVDYHESKLLPPTPVPMELIEGGSLPAYSVIGPLNLETFYIGKYEVTYAEWKEVQEWAVDNGYPDLAFDGNAPLGYGCDDDHPVFEINWYDCVKWCNAKSEMEGLTPVYTYVDTLTGEELVYRRALRLPIWNREANGYRLPSTYEWEFAARGGTKSVQEFTYAGNDKAGPVAWYLNNSGNGPCDMRTGNGYDHASTRPVGLKNPNELDLYDMSGNVHEWNWELDLTSNADRMLRGGSFLSFGLVKIKSAIGENAAYRENHYGFRIARNAE
jgi:formylglycine-generating enzyme required for sulfatase activity